MFWVDVIRFIDSDMHVVYQLVWARENTYSYGLSHPFIGQIYMGLNSNTLIEQSLKNKLKHFNNVIKHT